jgi:acyl-coenzyme A thioesterase PaaI-like protein
VTRSGPFWDVMAGRVPPPVAVLPGWELVAVDPDAGTIEVAFAAGDQFTNPVGVIQGGFLAAMLDDILGPVLVAARARAGSPPPPTSTCSSCARRGLDG